MPPSYVHIRLKSEPIDVVINLLTTLRDGWSQALTSLPADPTLNKAQEIGGQMGVSSQSGEADESRST